MEKSPSSLIYLCVLAQMREAKELILASGAQAVPLLYFPPSVKLYFSAQYSIYILLSGCGKVRSSAILSAILLYLQRDKALPLSQLLVWNLGFSAAFSPPYAYWILGESLAYYDLDYRPLAKHLGEYKKNHIFFYSDTAILDSFSQFIAQYPAPHLPKRPSFICEHWQKGLLISAEKLCQDREGLKDALKEQHSPLLSALAIDIESAALAHVCQTWSVRFFCLRMLIDKADKDSLRDYGQWSAPYAVELSHCVLRYLSYPD